MAAFYDTGTIEHFIKLSNGTISYLGSASLAPEIETRPAFIDIKNDLAGRLLPIDKLYDGEQHIINTTLNRFDWATYKSLSPSVVVPGGAGPGVLVDGKLNRGTLTFNSTSFQLILVYTFGGTVVAPATLPVGRVYNCCTLVGAKESTVGTRIMEVSLAIEANGLFNATTRAFSLYSELSADVLNGLPTPN